MLHISGDTRAGGAAESVDWTLLCKASEPIFAQTLTGFLASGELHDGAWHAEVVRQQPGAASSDAR
jgi:hypothetical protein